MDGNMGGNQRMTQNNSHLRSRLEHKNAKAIAKEVRWKLENSFFMFCAMKRPFSKHFFETPIVDY